MLANTAAGEDALEEVRWVVGRKEAMSKRLTIVGLAPIRSCTEPVPLFFVRAPLDAGPGGTEDLSSISFSFSSSDSESDAGATRSKSVLARLNIMKGIATSQCSPPRPG